MTGRAKQSPRIKAAFLKQLAADGNVLRAAAACAVWAHTFYTWRRSDADFAARWQTAQAKGAASARAAKDDARKKAARETRSVAAKTGQRPLPIPPLSGEGKKETDAALSASFAALGYTPRAAFAPWHMRTQRWSVTAAHRRSGKTVSRVAALVAGALACPLPRPRFAYIAPFAKQAKTVAWDYFKAFAAAADGRVLEFEQRIDFPNGGQVRLFGADIPDALRGIYLDGVVFDEFATMDPAIWPVVRPTLSDRGGWADFIGTPNGHNEFHRVLETAKASTTRGEATGGAAAGGDGAWYWAVLKASETGLLSADELASARRDLTAEQYAQEYECSFEAAIRGAYYGADIAAAERDGRIGAVPWDPNLEVHTAWDLGIGDATAIWMFQRAGRELRLIDYYEASGAGLDHYVRKLQERPYVYGRHFFPHDVKVRELGSGKSRAETLGGLGVYVTAVERAGLEDGIDAVRRMLPRCRFDASRCARGIEALRQYQTEWDDRARIFKARPRHDWTSHAADALRYLALAADYNDEPQFETPKPDLRWIV